MSKVKRQIVEIPIGNLSRIDYMFCSMMNLDQDNIPVKFRSAYDKTRDTTLQHVTISSVYESFEIDSNDGERIRLKNGITLESSLMAQMFRKAFELVFLSVSVRGYEELDEAEENMSLKVFLDAWGTAVIESANSWTEKYIAKTLEDEGLYCTYSFSPGQNNIPMDMQAQIFQALDPGVIGVTLNDKFLMHPKKSVTGIFGVQTERDEKGIRPCDLCEKKATCPNAYDKLGR